MTLQALQRCRLFRSDAECLREGSLEKGFSKPRPVTPPNTSRFGALRGIDLDAHALVYVNVHRENAYASQLTAAQCKVS